MFLMHSPKRDKSEEIQKQFADLYILCNNVTKCVIQTRDLSQNQETLDGYRDRLTETYNTFIEFAKAHAVILRTALTDRFEEKIDKLKTRVGKSLLKLRLNISFDGDLFQRITDTNLEVSLVEISDVSEDFDDLEEIVVEKKPQSVETNFSSPQTSSYRSEAIQTPHQIQTVQTKENLSTIASNNNGSSFIASDNDGSSSVGSDNNNLASLVPNNNNSQNTVPNNENIIMEAVAFLKLCSNTINRNYSGDPLSLDAFINSVMIVKSTVDEHDDILRNFVISKLEAKALEVLPDPKPTTTNGVLDALKAGIKLENSDIIAGKIIALKAENLSAQEFSTKAEELALSLRRSYINEGISKAKANDMAIKETVKLCKSSSKNVLVKSILASATYTEPRDVIAKYLTESENEKNETKNNILTFSGATQNRGNQRNNNGYVPRYRNDRYQNDRYQNRYTNRNFNRNNYNNNFNRNNYNNNFNRNNYNNFNRNQSYNNGSFRNQSNRGNTQNTNNSRNQYRQGNQNMNRNTRNVRYASGNEDVSQVQERTLGTVTENLNELSLE